MAQTEKTLDWEQYLKTAAQVVSEGIVMLKNDNDALPLNPDDEIALFGRIQLHYYKSGTGSGGMVNVSKITGIPDGLLENGVSVNEELLDVYRKWDSENPFDLGDGWGKEPWSQTEMPLDEALVAHVSESSHTAIVIIGRTAGEEQDNSLHEGSYLLTAAEKDMLAKVRHHFPKMIVLLNVGNIIDMNELLSFDEDDMEAITQAAIRQSNAAFGGGEDREKSLANIDTQLKRIVKMIERAYRDNAAGNLSDALLDEMMNRFGKERQALENQRDRLVTDTSEEKSIRDAYDLFFALAQRYSHIETLDRDILHALIERIEIGEKILPEGLTIAGPRTPYRQSIRIFYRFIGEIAENPVRDVTRVANL